jgi:hypothetical protein
MRASKGARERGGRLPECGSPPQIKIEKNTDYVDTVISKVFLSVIYLATENSH